MWDARLTALIACLIALSSLAACRSALEDSELAGQQVASAGPDQGNWNLDAAPFPGAGNYSGLTTTLSSSELCAGKSIFGLAGTRVCQNGTSASAASADRILAGREAWDASGNKITGTLPAGAIPASTAMHSTGSIAQPRLAGQSTSLQITQQAEVTTYAGAGSTPDLPTGAGYRYQEIPDTSEASYAENNPAPRPANPCGTAGTIAARIADCAAQNPTTSTYDGAANARSGEGAWKLVSRPAANAEVWQDQRTGLLWSSVVGSANWCRASGNTQHAPVNFQYAYNTAVGTAMLGSGTISAISGGGASATETIVVRFTSNTAVSVTAGAACMAGGSWTGALTAVAGSTTTYDNAGICHFTITQGSTNFANNDRFELRSVAAASSCAPGVLQPAAPLSYCAEAAGLNPPPGENWGLGNYLNAKGGMGANAATKVRWRLPTFEDYSVAEVNGLPLVMPDLGANGADRPTPDISNGSTDDEWAATVRSANRRDSYQYRPYVYATANRNAANNIRCVGR